MRRGTAREWGTFPVYEHGLWEVPANYGDRVAVMQSLYPDDAYQLFLEYAALKGVPEDVLAFASR
jgi:hypothetical protein